MPRADLTGESRSDHGQSSFPKLRLQAGEKARVVVIAEPGPSGMPQVFYEYVHRLEGPNIVNGAPTYVRIKTAEGGEAFKVEKRYVSNPLCSGDPEVLRERSLDAHGCEACRMAEEEPEIFWRPRPRYAANVIKYNLNPMGGGWNNLVNPYGVQIVVWVFSAKVMDKLIDIMQMGDAYRDPRMVDLLLECEKDGYNFQKPYSNGEFLPVAPALWLSTEQTRQYTGAVLANNQAGDDDLSASIGKQVKPEWVADDIRKIMQRWQIVRQYEARGATSIGVPGFGAESLQQGLSQLQQQYGQPPGGGQTPDAGLQVPQPAWTPQMADQAGQDAGSRTGQQGTAPPSGLAGLEEFMRATSTNPDPVGPPNGGTAAMSATAGLPGPGADPLGALLGAPGGLTPASQLPASVPPPSAPVTPAAAGMGPSPEPGSAPPAGNGQGDSRQYKFSDLVPPDQA